MEDKELKSDSLEKKDESSKKSIESNKANKKIKEKELIITPDEELTKRQRRRKKRYLKILSYSDGEKDIKYRGLLGIRGMRIFGWVLMALSAVAIAINIFASVVSVSGGTFKALSFFYTFASSFGQLAVPCFMLARFAILSKKKENFLNVVLVYLGLALAIAGVFFIVYFHYGVELVKAFKGVTWAEAAKSINSMFTYALGRKLAFNIFIDMLLWALFYMFFEAKPKKIKDNKNKMLLFRLCSLLPFLYVLIVFIFKVLYSLDIVYIHPYLSPFLPTSSPLTFLLFMFISLLLRHHERLFMAIGGTKEQYEVYSNTNANSFQVAKYIAFAFALVGIVNVIVEIILLLIYDETILDTLSVTGIADCSTYLLFAPFILLFSPTREFKYGKIDVMVTLGGFGLFILIIIEGFYRIILHFLYYLSE